MSEGNGNGNDRDPQDTLPDSVCGVGFAVHGFLALGALLVEKETITQAEWDALFERVVSKAGGQ